MDYKKIRIFVSSPKDVDLERKALSEVIERLNRTIADKNKMVLQLQMWENVPPRIIGSVQTVIEDHLEPYDIFIGIMWKRFGTQTERAGSGTEHEFDRAYELWKKNRNPHILFYFCNNDISFPKTIDEVDQLRKVILFKQKVEQLGLYATYFGIENFKWKVLEDLSHLIMEQVPTPTNSITDDTDWTITHPEYFKNFQDFNKKVDIIKWIAYTPVDFDPDIQKYPNEKSIEDDCNVIVNGPFKGIITFGSENSLGLVPMIAKKCGIHGIIMGIWDIKNDKELNAALECKDIVDGYCVGHRGLGQMYQLEELLKIISLVKKETKRPVSTTESIIDISACPKLIKEVDWIFPDMHYYWHEGATPEEVICDLITKIKKISILFKDIGPRRVLLKMISYPSSGGPNLNDSNQALFFKLLFRRMKNDTNIPNFVKISIFAAFDNIWKAPAKGWSLAELSTGIYNIERHPKDALAFIENPWKNP